MREGGSEPPAERASLHAIVRGRVQGVGFRDFVYTRARVLRLTGFVRNLSDGGAIEVTGEGSREALERLLEQLNRGPRSAFVRSVDVHWGEATGRYPHFDVLP